MVVNSLKAVLFVAGGAVVASAAAYVTGALDVFFPEKPQVVAAPQPQSAGAQPPPAAAVGQQMAALPSGGGTPAPADPVASGKEDRLVVPSFDLVRVEPDGSLVIAGRAAPKARVEVVTGSSVIGTDKAGDGGDFAVVLDDPLKPGDYTIVLRSTTPDNVVATSEETAIVSVPETQAGQVLALVEKPGAPSKLITVPQTQVAAVKPELPVASTQPEAQAKPAAQAAPAATQTPPAAASADQPGEAATPAAGGQPAATGKPAEPAQHVAEAPAAAPAQPQPAPAATAVGAAPSEQQQVAAAQPEQPKPAPAAEKPRISVEAVEIEGSRVFVAGRTAPDGRVRVYANEILLGDAKASPGGQFLVEAQRELPVGDYIVRADLLGPRAEVLARAAVPFEREPGETVAAVAPSEPAAQEPQAGAPKPQAEPGAKKADAKLAAEAAPTAVPAQAGGQQEAAAPADTAAPAGGDVAASAAGPQEVTAPKLKNVAGAVIIRRGDTLWRISRRVYGRGVRYTTIYLANQDQIEDPDRIWPGQVFSVPDKTGNGEQADMSAVADRVVPVE